MEDFVEGVAEEVVESTSTLDLYQVDSSAQVVANGASGQLTYSPSGWELKYAFTGRTLPPNKEYELVLISSENAVETATMSSMICMGSGVTNRFGSVLITGSVPTVASMPAPSRRQHRCGCPGLANTRFGY